MVDVSSLLSNASAASGGGGGVFSVLGRRQGTSAIQSILDSQQVASSRQSFFNNVAMRIEALRIGQIEPTEDWEKVAAYLSSTGKPYVVSVDRQGQVQVDAQAETDLSRYNETEQRKLTAAFDEVAEISRRIQANKQNQNWVDTLESVPATLDAMRQWGETPQPGWQTDAMVLQNAGVPFKVVLDEKGKLSVLDQTKARFYDTPPAQQRVLFDAMNVVRQTLKTGYSDGSPWAALAQVYSEAKQDYFLEVDPVTLGVLVKRNDVDNIVPKFLRTPPFADVGTDQPWKQAAADMIEQGKGFYLDLDTRGEIIVRANDGRGINLLDKPRNATVRNPIVDLFA